MNLRPSILLAVLLSGLLSANPSFATTSSWGPKSACTGYSSTGLLAHNNPVNGIDPSGHSLVEQLNLVALKAYLFAASGSAVVKATAAAFTGLTAALFVADEEFRAVYISSGGNPFVEARYVLGAVRTLRTSLAVARASRVVTQTTEAFTLVESGIITEARQILGSTEMAQIRAAQEAGRTIRVAINGRTVQYEPGLPFSAMTWAEREGFILSDQAFASSDELAKTVIHELHRLNTSVALAKGAVGGSAATRETRAAYDFAERALEEVLK